MIHQKQTNNGNIISAFIIITLLCGVFFIHNPAHSKNAIYYNTKGWEALKKGDTRKAIFYFRNSLHKNKKYKNALLGLAKSYYSIEAYQKAYALYTEVLKIEPHSNKAHVGLGMVLIGLGQYTKAIKQFETAIKQKQEDLDAHYGVAYLYSRMGKYNWAYRKIKSILRLNPFHYDTLLLKSHIKSTNKRYGEAKKYVQKAIDSDTSNPRGYISFGEIALKQYLQSEKKDYLKEATQSLNNALSIQPAHFYANRFMGYISLLNNAHNDAVTFYKNALKVSKSPGVRYSLALAYEGMGNKDDALKNYLRVIRDNSLYSIARSQTEHFLVFRDYKMGHPARIMLYKEHLELARKRSMASLPDEAVLYLRRALLLNPMSDVAHLSLMEYYKVLDYHRFYMDLLKDLHRINEKKYRDQLVAAVIKRRKKLYHREGYSAEMPPRNVPVVFVLNFSPNGKITMHPNAGKVIADYLTFLLQQFGRMKPVSLRNREKIANGLSSREEHLYKSLGEISNKSKEKIDYIIYGSFTESDNHITLHFNLLNNTKGYTIDSFSVSERGKESLPVLALRAAQRVYNTIPFQGKVLKIKDKGIIVNLGIFDGIFQGSRLIINKFNNRSSDSLKQKLIFTVREADTIVAYAEPQNTDDIYTISSNDIVIPLKKRRAKRIK